MKVLLSFLFFIVTFSVSFSQDQKSIDTGKLIRVWGQVSVEVPVHRGKEGLVLLQLKTDSSFLAYENTDYGASILQVGKWWLSGNSIFFEVSKTILARPEKEYAMKGIILEKEKGRISYRILLLEENNFMIQNTETYRTINFKPSQYNYFPKGNF
jgi:hypothetical protein